MSVTIDDLTIREARQLASMFNSGSNSNSNSPNTTDTTAPWEIGKNYLIRTVTMIDTGKLVAVYPDELVLESAAWIADTGRFSKALASCDFAEVEPFPEGDRVIVGRGSIVDAFQIKNLPRSQK